MPRFLGGSSFTSKDFYVKIGVFYVPSFDKYYELG